MSGRGESRFAGAGWAVLALAAALLAGCATGKQEEVRKLQARSAYEQGVKDFSEGRPAIALSSLQQAIDLDPSVPQFHNALGLLYLNVQRDYSAALEEFKRAVELDPRYGEAYHNLGVANALLGRWEDAIREYRQALSIPGYANLENTHHNLGWAYYNLGRLREAEESFSLVIQLDPKNGSAYYHLGLVLEKAGRQEEARAAFRQTRALGPDTPVGLSAKEHLKALGEGG